VERFFGLLSERRIRCGTFGSIRELESAIRDYLAHHNQDPKPFTWTADADSILRRLAGFVCELLTQDTSLKSSAALLKSPLSLRARLA
jgi:hypothetical protein